MFPCLPLPSHKSSVNCCFLSWNTSLVMLHGRSQNEVTVSLRSILLTTVNTTQISVRKCWWEERNTEEFTCERTSQDHGFIHGWNILCESNVWRLTLFVRWVFDRHVTFSCTASFQVHWETKVWFLYLYSFFSEENFALKITRDARHIGHHIGTGWYTFFFNVIVVSR